MITFLWIVYVLVCLLMIGIILLQPGEGGDLASAFGGASSQTAFGARGSATVLQKATTILAVIFMVLSIVLVILTNLHQKNIMEQNLPAVKQNTPAQQAPPASPKQNPAPGSQSAPKPAK
ncbi:MAG: preprotein translocase subunit SecG [Acidobacteriota bacterium]